MFARHEYRTRERDKRAVRAVVRWWHGKLKPQAFGSRSCVSPDCPFDVLSESRSGSAWRSNVITGSTGYVVKAEAPRAPERKATNPTIARSALPIGAFPLENNRF